MFNSRIESYWLINGLDARHDTLEDVKRHIWAQYTNEDKMRFLNNDFILHIVDYKLRGLIHIKMKRNGAVKYTKVSLAKAFRIIKKDYSFHEEEECWSALKLFL